MGAGKHLTYSLEQSHDNHAKVAFSGAEIKVLIPAIELYQWCSTEETSIKRTIDVGNDTNLTLLIEKDFTCLNRRDEDESDLFKNPALKSSER